MENDEIISPGMGRILCGITICVLAFAGYMVATSLHNGVMLKKQESFERMYLACLDKLVKSDQPEFVTQLTACKLVKE